MWVTKTGHVFIRTKRKVQQAIMPAKEYARIEITKTSVSQMPGAFDELVNMWMTIQSPNPMRKEVEKKKDGL